MSSYLCRLCFETHHVKTNDYSNYYQTIGSLMDVFPGMNLNLTKSIQLCDTCFSNLQFAFKLKQKFLEGISSTFLNRKATINNRYCTVCFKSENILSFMMFNDSSKIILKRMIQIVLSVNMDDNNPNVCRGCWSQIKASHSFKIHCVKIEKNLNAYCFKKQLSKLTENDLKTFVTEQAHQIHAISHKEYYEKYGHVYPNLDYMQKTHSTSAITQHKNVQEPYAIQKHSENPKVTDKNCSIDDDCIVVADNTNVDAFQFNYSNNSIIIIEDEESRSATEVIPNKHFEYNNNDATIIIDDDEPVPEYVNYYPEYNNNYSAFSIYNETTRSAIEEDNTNFDLNKIVEYNNNDATIVIEDDETRPAIVKVNAKNIEYNNNCPTIVIEDEESDSMIVQNNATFNPMKIVEHNNNKDSTTLDDEDLLVIDQDICEIGTESELSTEHIFVETKYNINRTQVAQLHTNAVRPATNLKLWGCYVCPQVFMEKYKMRRHLMGHELLANKNGRFKCKICSYCCRFVRSLTMHNWIHSRKFGVKFSGIEAKYFCQYCDDIFSKQDDMGLHMRKHLISSKKFLCTECYMSTGSSEALRVHYRKLHGQKKLREL